MGIIDKTTYVLTCKECHKKESSVLLDKGSNWGGSSWQDRANFEYFIVDWKGGGIHEPEIQSAKCLACNSTQIEIERN